MDAENLGATPAEAREYGSNLSFWDSLRLLQRWSPLIGFARSFTGTADPYKRTLIVADACEWVASQTDAQLDDQLVRHIAAVLVTPQGEALVRFCISHVGVR